MKEYFRNIILISLPATIMMFLVTEVFIRLYKDHIDLYALTGRGWIVNPMSEWAVNDPFAVYRPKPARIYSEGKSVNTHGFISTPEIQLTKPENTVRIVFLGESSTAGVGPHLKDEDTWPRRACENLREKTSAKIDFINAAAPGYTTFESFGRLWSRLRFYKPDIIVVCHAWNDIYYFTDEMVEDPTIWRSDSTGFWRIDGMIPNYITRIKPHWIDPFIKWSQFLSRVRVKLFYSYSIGEAGEMASAERTRKGAPPTIKYNERGADIFENNLMLIKMAADLMGAELFVVKQATLITPFTSPADRLRCQYHFHGIDHDAHLKAFSGIYRIIDKEISRSHVIDATPLSGVSAYFADHIHTTALGAEKIADVVSKHLLETYFKADTSGQR